MLDFKIEIKGIEQALKSAQKEMEAAIIEEYHNYVKKTERSIRCPVHRKRPKIIVKVRNRDNISLKISGCCKKLINKVERKLR